MRGGEAYRGLERIAPTVLVQNSTVYPCAVVLRSGERLEKVYAVPKGDAEGLKFLMWQTQCFFPGVRVLRMGEVERIERSRYRLPGRFAMPMMRSYRIHGWIEKHPVRLCVVSAFLTWETFTLRSTCLHDFFDFRAVGSGRLVVHANCRIGEGARRQTVDWHLLVV